MRDNLYAGSVNAADGSHHIIFLSQRMARVLRKLKILFGDGTFKVLPVLDDLDEASQVFCIVGNWEHTVIPLAWVLMQNRTIAAYTAVLTAKNFPNLETFVSDFEAAIRASVAARFPNVTVQGCYFHVVRFYIRYAKETLGMYRILRRQPFERLMKLCCTLPLLPRQLIRRGFNLILEEARGFGLRVYRQMRPFFSYLLRNWVGQRMKREWKCVFQSEHRTNNTCESQNRMLRNYVRVAHPNVYQFISALVSVEMNAASDARALERGNKPNRARKTSSIMLDRRLGNLARAFRHPPDNLDNAIMRYLHAASYSFAAAYDRAIDDV